MPRPTSSPLALLRRILPVLAALLALTARPPIARAVEYETFIEITSEEELYDLFAADQISEETFNTLIDVIRRGVDLDSADRTELYTLPNLTYDDVDRIVEYRELSGGISNPRALLVAGVLTERKLRTIAPFLLVVERGRKLAATNGFVRYQTAWSGLPGRVQAALPANNQVPPMALQARLTTLRHLTIGFAGVLTRNRVSAVRWDPNRDALSGQRAEVQAHAPKYFATWDTEKWGIVAGTYRIGFGQRLTFDNSGRYTPNGFYFDDALVFSTNLRTACRESAGELATSPCLVGNVDLDDVYVTPDWQWRDGLRGIAVGAKHIGVKKGWLQLYGFGSHQRRDLYQYELYNRDTCADPQEDDNDQCGAPEVWVRNEGQDPLDPTSRFKFQTLPDIYDEVTGGGNFTYFHERRTHVGVTGYGTAILWNVEGADLDFQEWSRTPYGGAFGAVGADAAWGRKWSDLFVEITRSIDSQPRSQLVKAGRGGGGGFGGVLRHTATWDTHEIETAVRYYDRDFNNPNARAISAPDEVDGLRARDEAGVRVRYNGVIKERLILRTLADFWLQPSGADVSFDQRRVLIPKLRAQARADVQATKWFRPGLWLQYQNKDLQRSGRNGVDIDGDGERDGQCYEVSVEFDENGEPVPCGGEQYQLFVRLRFEPHKRVTISSQYQHDFLDEDSSSVPENEIFADSLRQDVSAWIMLTSQPIDGWRLRARYRHRFEDIQNADRLEHSSWLYFDTAFTFRRRFKIRARYDLRIFLDDRGTTPTRIPGGCTQTLGCRPEHWVRAEVEVRF